jgi:hypothetical protein
VRQLKHLCQDDPGALDAIDRATVGHQKKQTNLVYNINKVNERPSSTSNTYALRKLRKDRPDLHERVVTRG